MIVHNFIKYIFQFARFLRSKQKAFTDVLLCQYLFVM